MLLVVLLKRLAVVTMAQLLQHRFTRFLSIVGQNIVGQLQQLSATCVFSLLSSVLLTTAVPQAKNYASYVRKNAGLSPVSASIPSLEFPKDSLWMWCLQLGASRKRQNAGKGSSR
ncbi:MAG: hypothetical protein TQ37_07660 [Candidatus Synechococcus spongiarum 15L]|uniref:Uncharacterized protein n=1 Tax=Candidatus Synechococcus spongiarum 15L TaxID=1608419 RepID=A0A0G8ATW1_9SYNE|nr:MAG: hypothetical protein TQ37_07660 [Candidatus Synechococcus spongiarum 15L]